jgi:hypothetical protein
MVPAGSFWRSVSMIYMIFEGLTIVKPSPVRVLNGFDTCALGKKKHFTKAFEKHIKTR